MKKMQIGNGISAIAALTLALGLGGCQGIGEGSTLQSIEVRPGSGETVASGSSYRLHECIRDQLVAIGTFTDGTTADFSFRTRWTSSDPSAVEVSNGELLNPLVVSGVFSSTSSFTMRPGTVVPHAITSTPVTITAEFLGKRSSLNVTVGTPSLRISPVPDTTLTPNQPTHLGVGTQQRFGLVISRDGQVDMASSFNLLGPINPVLWRFSPGPNVAFAARDTAVALDFDKYTVSNGADIVATVNVLTGTVTAVKADPAAYPIEAHLSVCSTSGGTAPADPVFTATNPALRPTSQVRVANFTTVNPLMLAGEPDFNGPGVNNGDVVVNTQQNLSVTAALDTDGNLATAEQFQNLTSQARFNLDPKDTACDSSNLNCLANTDFSLSAFSNQLLTTAGSTGGTVRADACLPYCISTLASLAADNTNPAVTTAVNFTATAVNPTPGLASGALSYTFNFGDGATAGPQASASASHAYAADGSYTATVRVTDATGALAQNAGATQIRVGAVPADNTAPTAVSIVSPSTGIAPVTIQFNATASSDPNAGDRVAVYEFSFGDGTVVRQSGPIVSYVYVTAPAAPPSVRVIDTFGVASAPVALAVTVTGSATLLPRSNGLSFNAVPATLSAVNICVLPNLACTTPASVTEPAFTYPGQQFEGMGSFTATSDCTATPSACFNGGASTTGIQKITRIIGWATRPAADSAELSDIAFVRNFTDDLLRTGQVEYVKNVAADTPLSITVTVPALFNFSGTVPPATLTVTNCATCPP